MEHARAFAMMIVGFDIIAALITRETRERSQQGKTLNRRIAAWKHELERARWEKPSDLKAAFGTADIVGGGRVVFDICGNNYRLVVQFDYVAGIARVRFAGTHAEYDRIDVTKV
jgi:mRNA interferase HigB